MYSSLHGYSFSYISIKLVDFDHLFWLLVQIFYVFFGSFGVLVHKSLRMGVKIFNYDYKFIYFWSLVLSVFCFTYFKSLLLGACTCGTIFSWGFDHFIIVKYSSLSLLAVCMVYTDLQYNSHIRFLKTIVFMVYQFLYIYILFPYLLPS